MTHSIAIVGNGRLGTTLAGALRTAGHDVSGPLGRGADGFAADLVLLCVPDAEIEAAAACIVPGAIVGHCSGATPLDVLGDRERLALHPLMTVPRTGASLRGAGCAIAGSTPQALARAHAIATDLGMRPFAMTDADRPAYHAAASIASNFLVTLEAFAERLASSAGVPRDALAPLVRATVDNWAAEGPARALTGPIARGDSATVARQRHAVAAATPDLLHLVDALAQATADLASGRVPSDGRGMRTIRTIADLRAALAAERRAGRSVALVPTMGALHDGHLSLVRAARAQADLVVVSLFVNPAQFNDVADLDAYPHDEARDSVVAAAAGADVLFAPRASEIYPPGGTTQIVVRGPLTETLEGAHRGRTHFDGVTTVVAKLLNIVQPDIAVFGRKDAQQALVIGRLVADLDIPVRIAVEPTVRDDDGLALSSRNARLDAGARARARALPQVLHAAARALAEGTPAREVEADGLRALRDQGLDPEYFAVVDPVTLAPTEDGNALVLAAAVVGGVRLIDNVSALHPAPVVTDRTAQPITTGGRA